MCQNKAQVAELLAMQPGLAAELFTALDSKAGRVPCHIVTKPSIEYAPPKHKRHIKYFVSFLIVRAVQTPINMSSTSEEMAWMVQDPGHLERSLMCQAPKSL